MAAATQRQAKVRGTVISSGEQAAHITTNNTGEIIRTGPCKVGQIVVKNPGTAWTVTFYDGIDASGPVVWPMLTADGKGVIPVQMPCQTGLFYVSAGTTPGDIAVIWER